VTRHPSRQAPREAHRALGVLAIILLCATTASAQVPVVAYDGVEIFCHVLKHFQLEPIPNIDDLRRYPAEETLIVVFGDLTPLDAIRQQVDLNNVAVLIASDRATGRIERIGNNPENIRIVDSQLAPWNLIIGGAQVRQPEADAYQGKPRCPMLKPDPGHPVFRNLRQGLATNGPSYLNSWQSDLHLLAEFPGNCTTNPKQADWKRHDPGYIYGTRGDDQQRTLILAGHGVFMNGMLVQADNDNFRFAVNAVRWLREGPAGAKRKYALMIHEGKALASFDLPLTGMPDIPINKVLHEIEAQGLLNKFLEEQVGWHNVLRFLILAATTCLLVYGMYRLFLTRHTQENVPLIVGILPPPAPGRPLLQQRQLELLSQDNLWEPAQTLARQWFLDHADVEAPLWDEADQAPPDCQFRGGWLARMSLARQVRRLWDFAVRDPARRVTLREFRRLTDLLQTLTAAVQDGRLTFAAQNGGR
jgi:hypothetical protein